MSEKIIVDGVNVTQCFHRATNAIGKDYGTYCREFTGSCVGQKCYYKQLKRLEQENEKLKAEVDTWKYQAQKSDEMSDIDFAKQKKYKQTLEEVRSLFDAITNGELKTFNEIDAGKIILQVRKKIDEVLND